MAGIASQSQDKAETLQLHTKKDNDKIPDKELPTANIMNEATTMSNCGRKK